MSRKPAGRVRLPVGRATVAVGHLVGHLAEDAWHRLDFRRWLVLAGVGLRQGLRRARGSAMPILLASVAAAMAYWLAHDGFGHQMPIFAAVAAWICLGFTYNRVPRKVLEMGLGAALGVGIGEVVLLSFGTGPLQAGLGLVLGALTGRLLDRGDLFTMQAGVNSMVVIGLGALAPGAGGFTRLLDALIGAGIGLIFSVALPGDVLARPRRYIASLHTELATATGMIAQGIRVGNAERLRDAAAQLRGVHRILTDAEDVLNSSSDIIALHPTLRRYLHQLEEERRQWALLNRTVATAELLQRQIRGVVQETGANAKVADLLDEATAVLHSMAGAVRAWQRPERARVLAADLARRCAPKDYTAGGWRAVVLVSLMRSMVIDLLQLTGLSRDQGRQLLPDTGHLDETIVVLPEDDASRTWGLPRATRVGMTDPGSWATMADMSWARLILGRRSEASI